MEEEHIGELRAVWLSFSSIGEDNVLMYLWDYESHLSNEGIGAVDLRDVNDDCEDGDGDRDEDEC